MYNIRMLTLVIDRYKEKCDDNYEVLELVRDLIEDLRQTEEYDRDYTYYSSLNFLCETADELEKQVFGGTWY